MSDPFIMAETLQRVVSALHLQTELWDQLSREEQSRNHPRVAQTYQRCTADVLALLESAGAGS